MEEASGHDKIKRFVFRKKLLKLNENIERYGKGESDLIKNRELEREGNKQLRHNVKDTHNCNLSAGRKHVSVSQMGT